MNRTEKIRAHQANLVRIRANLPPGTKWGGREAPVPRPPSQLQVALEMCDDLDARRDPEGTPEREKTRTNRWRLLRDDVQVRMRRTAFSGRNKAQRGRIHAGYQLQKRVAATTERDNVAIKLKMALEAAEAEQRLRQKGMAA